jgi:hypothetical protein
MNTLTASPGAEARTGRLAHAPWVAIVGIGGALADLAVAALYWSRFQVEAIRIPQGIAAWFIGRDAFHGGVATALLGILLYAGLVYAVCALYGMLAYGVIFWILAPLLTGDGGSTKPEWLGLCVVTYILAIGIPAALAARATLAGSHD